MTHVEIPAVDYARAKNAAKAVKTRLHELGNNVCLNHAYEAVAATLGFKTWAVMKANLDKGDGARVASGPISAECEVRQRGQPTIGDLTVGENNPVVMVHGPAGSRRNKTVSGVAKLNVNPKRPFRVIGLGAPDTELAAYLANSLDKLLHGHGHPAGQDDIVFTLNPYLEKCSVNPFDLPYGATAPAANKRAWLVSFLQRLAGDGHRTTSSRFLEQGIDLLYKKFMFEEPFRYHAGVNEDVDAHLAGAVLPDGVTWIAVARFLMQKFQMRLARLAWRHASPRLEHLMTVLRHEDLLDIGGYRDSPIPGERLADKYVRVVSSAVREYPFFRRPTAVDFDGGAVRIIGIEQPNGPADSAVALMFRLVAEQCFFGDDRGATGTRVVSSGAELIQAELVELMELAHAEGDISLIVASDRELPDLERLTTTHVVSGCASRAAVQEVCARLNISGVGFELIHDRLFEDFDEKRIETFCVRRKFVGQREGMVVIPLRSAS